MQKDNKPGHREDQAEDADPEAGLKRFEGEGFFLSSDGEKEDEGAKHGHCVVGDVEHNGDPKGA